MNPRIPDEAFQAVTDRSDELHAVMMATASSVEEAGNAAHNYARSLGLEGENDPRAYALAPASWLHLSQGTGHTVMPSEIRAAVVGIQLGLPLARETGWEPPM